MSEFWSIVLPPVVTILATALVGLITQLIVAVAKYYIPLLQERIGSEQFALWKETAALIVRSIEQSPAYSEFASQEKKQKAMMELSNWFENRGIPVTVDLLDKLIEAAVQEMKSEIGAVLSLG